VLNKKKRTVRSRRKDTLKRSKRKPKATVSKLLERLEALLEVTVFDVTSLTAEANGRAARAEKKFCDLEARVAQLTECLSEDHLEAARVVGVDALSYLTGLLQLKSKQLFTIEEIGALAPYSNETDSVDSRQKLGVLVDNGLGASIVPLSSLPRYNPGTCS
jgi:hypothetical protein